MVRIQRVPRGGACVSQSDWHIGITSIQNIVYLKVIREREREREREYINTKVYIPVFIYWLEHWWASICASSLVKSQINLPSLSKLLGQWWIQEFQNRVAWSRFLGYWICFDAPSHISYVFGRMKYILLTIIKVYACCAIKIYKNKPKKISKRNENRRGARGRFSSVASTCSTVHVYLSCRGMPIPIVFCLH